MHKIITAGICGLTILSLAACGNESTHNKTSSSVSTSSVAKSSSQKHHSHKKNSASTSQTSSSATSDSTSSAESSNSSNSTTAASSSVAGATSSANYIDTKNLTNSQAINWIKAHMNIVLDSQYNTAENQATNHNVTFTVNDFDYVYNGHSGGWDGASDDAVYYAVQENHNSTNMQAAGADPATTHLAAWFRINRDGQLQVQKSVANPTWQTISTTYDAN